MERCTSRCSGTEALPTERMSALPAPGLKRSALNWGCTGTVCARAATEAATAEARTAFPTSATARPRAERRRHARHNPTSATASNAATPLPSPDAQPPEPATTQTPGLPLGWHWPATRSEEHTSELQSHHDLVCRLLLEKKKKKQHDRRTNKTAQKYNTNPRRHKVQSRCHLS